MPPFQLVFDTTFFVLHYFSAEKTVYSKTREALRRSRKLGNRGILPTIVLAEFYAQATKRVGGEEAKRRFEEMVGSDLEVIELDTLISEQAGVLRHKYQEKVPWSDCIIAATAVQEKVSLVLSEDPHFNTVREIKVKRLDELAL